MKRILVVVDEECSSACLIDTYNALYSDKIKELYYCNISLFTCNYAHTQIRHLNVKQKMLETIQNPFTSFISSSRPKEYLQAASCSDIKNLIKKYKITDVILPHYLDDAQKNSHYLQIATTAKKINSVNHVIGVFK